ncbi:MAG TPA: HAD-IIIC family phosphatase, partial [Actinomycetota bacterium]|nr:HAD-IIIC family phosphatase [Actinomycetota bacterium]
MKCVVWDLDGTIWDGIAVEMEEPGLPRLFPDVVGILDELESRGIANSVASRNSTAVGEALARVPELAGRFLAPQLGWGDKSESLRRIADELGIGLDALAVVDDSPYERAEIRQRAPEVLVLSPEELRAAIDGPPFVPEHSSSESRLRVARLRDEAARKAAQESADVSREEFLRSCRMQLSLASATFSDVDRLAELVARARRLSSSGTRITAGEIARRVDDPRWSVVVARLVDRFGDYGSIGAAFV